MMHSDMHSRHLLHTLTRFFERCVVSSLIKVCNRQCATTAGHVRGVELLSLDEIKRKAEPSL